MNQKTFTLALLITVYCSLFTANSFSQPVSSGRAEIVALNFLKEHFTKFNYSKEVETLQLTVENLNDVKSAPEYYIFNIANENGFVIVAGDERIYPILGYSTTSRFNKNDVAPGLLWLLKEYEKQINYNIDNNLYSSSDVDALWERYESGDIKDFQETESVVPLTTTTWSQCCYYNAMCPADPAIPASECGRCATGCVATAFGQVMKYYNWPVTGVGSKTYTQAGYGTLSANFGSTTYNWASMPNKLLSNNSEVARLLFHVGVSINMEYGVEGSAAFFEDVKKALVTNFRYATTARVIYKSSYTEANWATTVRNELNAARLVLIAGDDIQHNEGHTFIIDGYPDNTYFHVNWGWNGSDDGNFLLSNLAPVGYSFNSSVSAIIGIMPATGSPCCSGITTLTATSGIITDGSSTNNYGNNSSCKWLIAPTGATSVTLTFTAFNTESTSDYVKIYNGETTTSPLLGTFSGTSIPTSITANSGKMLVQFVTNSSVVKSGWSANYTSAIQTCTCPSTTTLTALSGAISDGSGSNNYSNNSDCKWLIKPTGALTVTLNFNSFNTESANDIVKIYNGETTSSPLIGSFSGYSIPAAITASSGKMLVHFTSNSSVQKSGWSASYTSSTCYCAGTATLTSSSGSISDGSGSNYYANNSDCKWLIKPTGATSITLNFTAFNTEASYDYVKIFNGTTTSSPLIGTFSGSAIPSSVTANSGKMLVQFVSNGSTKKPGWSANYTSSVFKNDATDILNLTNEDTLTIYPNPNNGTFTINITNNYMGNFSIVITDILGRQHYSASFDKTEANFNRNITIDKFPKGIYFIQCDFESHQVTRQIIVN